MIELDWQAVSIAVAIGTFVAGAWTGFLVWSIKYLIDRALRNSDKRFERIEETLKDEQAKRDQLERDFLDFVAKMPERYVARDDWIRLATTIDAKMDRLVEKFSKFQVDVLDRLGGRNARS